MFREKDEEFNEETSSNSKNGIIGSNKNDVLKLGNIYTRMFYAQRFMEEQYKSVSENDRIFKAWNDFIFQTLKVEAFDVNNSEKTYPTWVNNNLSSRTTHWFVGVGLITSEIMGACLIPNSISMLGYVPSNILLFVFFFITIAAGFAVWWVFLLFDSPEYPVKTFADLAHILGGKWCKNAVIFLQIIAIVLTTATILITAAESVIILREQRMCWVGLMALLAGVMAVLSTIRQLSVLGKYCLVFSLVNYINLFVQLGYIGNYEPNWKNAESILGISRDVIQTFAITPHQSLVNRVVAVCNLSFVFGGTLVFPEVISEMRTPWQFWKTMTLAQTMILVVYLIFGNYVYSFQGQFSNIPTVFGISDLKALKGLGFITFVTGCIQGIFYGHICAKVVYKNYIPMIIKDIKFNSKIGFILWISMVVFIWVTIFVIGSGVPQVGAVAAFTSALTMIPLTFVVPFLANFFALYFKANAQNLQNFTPLSHCSGSMVNTMDTGAYWKAGYCKYPYVSIFNGSICLASLAFSGLGLWASVEYMKYIFASTSATTFSCTSPI